MTTTMRPCFFLTCGDWVISLDVPFHLQEMLVENHWDQVFVSMLLEFLKFGG